MPPPSSRRTALLDWAAGIGLAGPAFVMLQSADVRPVWITWILLSVIVASVAVWIIWRRVPRLERVTAVAFALCAVGSLVVSDGPLAFGTVWVACLVLARTFNGLVALYYTTVLCLMVIVLHAVTGSSWETITIETVSTAVLAGFGAAFALVLHDGERVERERERLSAEREATLASLAHANMELQRRQGSEQDLALAQERERAARELHDGLGHRLTAVGLSLEFAGRVRDRDPERAWLELARARTIVSDALDNMRRLVRAMHPVELGAMRGTDAFAAIADAFRSTGLDIRVTVDGARELSREHSLLLVRFVQEGLTNVVRHADASHVELHVRAHPTGVEASIEDLGIRPAPPGGEGFGLRSLRARAETLGGSLDARPTPHGFLMRISLPSESGALIMA
ncbi:sensor histidine kinase [Luethyella okanaganae]|uniref:histidine kinase n=1 Tax=Luethyella okanaganae TaxID=69372 RepID=A0ABW1VCF0_9MICO